MSIGLKSSSSSSKLNPILHIHHDCYQLGWSQTQGQLLITPCLADRQVLLVAEARCFIQEPGNLGRWQTGVPQNTSELPIRARAFKGKRRGFAGGGYVQSSTVSSDQHPEIVVQALVSIILFGVKWIFSSRVELFLFSWAQVLEVCHMEQLMSFLQPGHHAVSFFPLVAVFSSVQFWVRSNSLRPHGLQHARPPCPLSTPGGYSNSCPSSQWCHATISPAVFPFSSGLQSFPESGSFLLSQFFPSGGQSIGISASASVLPMYIQDWFPLGWTGWISLQSKGLSRVFSQYHSSKASVLQHSACFMVQLSHPYMTTGKQ